MARMRCFDDLPAMPGTGEGPEALFARALPLEGSPGQAYVEGRGVAAGVADAAGVRFAPDFGGRPAVVGALWDARDRLTSVHGRYLRNRRGQEKMLTIGPGNGVLNVLGGWRTEPLILVEGLFDALSLAVCGRSAVATIGRRASWLPEAAQGRTVWLAFDAGKPGEAEAARHERLLLGAQVRRLTPPPRCQDWNTALKKRGARTLGHWLDEHLEG